LINIVTLRAFLMKVEALADPPKRKDKTQHPLYIYYSNKIDMDAAKWRAKKNMK